MRKPLLTIIAGIALIALLAGACSKPQAPGPRAEKPVRGGTFTVGAAQDAMILNPILAQDTASTFINSFVFDSLLRLNDRFEYRPGLAEALPTVEEGGRKWTFRLRRDVKFHDGQPLTSKDVRFTFEAILHPGYSGARTSHYNSLKGAAALRAACDTLRQQVTQKKLSREDADRQSVEAWEKWRRESGAILTPDPYTVIFQSDFPFAPLLAYVANTGILPEHKLKDEVGARMRDSTFNRSPVGSGRYAFMEWRPGERIVLDANESWWGGSPNIAQVIWRVLPDPETAMDALENGAVDSASIDIARADHFAKDVEHVRLFEYPTTVYHQVALDLNNDLFRDIRVRQAMAYAVNKDALVDRILGEHGTAAWSHGTPTRWDYNPDVPKYPYDLSRAITLLQEAGWVRGTDGIRSKEGKKFAFTLYYNAAEKADLDTAQYLQTAWRAVGLEVAAKGADFATLLDLTDAANPERKQPPAYLLGWELGSEPDSYSVWACDGIYNDIGYCNLRVDSLLKQGRSELDQEKRKALYQQLQAVLAEDQPYIWLYFPSAIQGINARVRGPIGGTPAGIYWNFEAWWMGDGG